MSITTHVLDIAAGRPAAGVAVALEMRQAGGGWARLGQGVTDQDGRLAGLVPAERRLEAGVHRLLFDTGAWFAQCGQAGFYPEVSVVFEVSDPTQHYHVPLLLSAHGYTTYRGS
jgi:5-hydroxyisourate hydrolase